MSWSRSWLEKLIPSVPWNYEKLQSIQPPHPQRHWRRGQLFTDEHKSFVPENEKNGKTFPRWWPRARAPRKVCDSILLVVATECFARWFHFIRSRDDGMSFSSDSLSPIEVTIGRRPSSCLPTLAFSDKGHPLNQRIGTEMKELSY